MIHPNKSIENTTPEINQENNVHLVRPYLNEIQNEEEKNTNESRTIN